ncbi:MAG TPA: hypothetical protein VKW76_07665 [Candidatus Binatia bacterium]|nr:hypothetical protein [Candidatus Binatia bacterium]
MIARGVAVAGLGMLLVTTGSASAKVPACPSGSYTVSGGGAQTLNIDTSTKPATVTYTGCEPGTGHVRGTRKGTKVTATFPSCSACAVSTKKAHFKATISPDCTSVPVPKLVCPKRPPVASGGKTSGAPVSFATTIAPMLAASCATASCHTGSNPSEGLTLDADKSYAAIVNVPSLEQPSLKLVSPSKPKSSYLLMKVLGTASQGAPMPLTGTPLSSSQIQQLSDWITQGAQNN